MPQGSLKEAFPLARPILGARPPRPRRRRALVHAVTDFLIHLRLERAASPNTLRAYQRDLRSFCRFLAERGADPHTTPPEAIMRPDVRAYLAHLSTERSLRSTSIVRHLACLRSFFRFLSWDASWHLGHDPTEGISRPRVVRPAPLSLTPRERDQILAACERISPYPRRDRCALHLVAATGCRVGDLLRVRLGDVALDHHRILFRARPAALRAVSLPPEAVESLRRYLQEERPQLAAAGRLPHDAPHGPLFLNARGTGLSPATVERIFRKARAEAGITRPVSLLSLRRTRPNPPPPVQAGPFVLPGP